MYRNQSCVTWCRCLFGLFIGCFVECLRCFNWRLSYFEGLQPMERIFWSARIKLPSQTKKCKVPCSGCKILFEGHNSHRGASFQNRVSQCCPNLWLKLTASRQALYILRGAMWRHCAKAKLWLICVLAGIEISCAGVLQRIPVSDSIMVAPTKWNIIKARCENFRCCRRGACQMRASCFPFSWSAWAQQNSCFARQAEEKNFSKSSEVVLQIWDCEFPCNVAEAILGRGS